MCEFPASGSSWNSLAHVSVLMDDSDHRQRVTLEKRIEPAPQEPASAIPRRQPFLPDPPDLIGASTFVCRASAWSPRIFLGGSRVAVLPDHLPWRQPTPLPMLHHRVAGRPACRAGFGLAGGLAGTAAFVASTLAANSFAAPHRPSQPARHRARCAGHGTARPGSRTVPFSRA
jgi:hypothetical protein